MVDVLAECLLHDVGVGGVGVHGGTEGGQGDDGEPHDVPRG